MPQLDPSNAEATSRERRGDRRQRTLLHGKLVFPAAGVSQDCTIRNMSGDGARLQTSAPPMLSAGGVVVVTKTGAAHEIDLVWRRGGELGVKFTASHDLNAGAPSRLAHARRLWTEHRAR